MEWEEIPATKHVAPLSLSGDYVYYYRGMIERAAHGKYRWVKGYSRATANGGIEYPWITRREVYKEAKAAGMKVRFE